MIQSMSELNCPSVRGDALFEDAYKILLGDLYGDIARCKRPAAVTCGTLYNLLLQRDKDRIMKA